MSDRDQQNDTTSSYVEVARKRNRLKNSLIRQIRKRVNVLRERTGTVACLLYMKGDRVFCEGTNEMKANFAKDSSVQTAFKKAALRNGLGVISNGSSVTFPPKDAHLTVIQLREIILAAVTTDSQKNYVAPKWGNPSFRPIWWPQDIPYQSPSSGKFGLKRNSLIAIYESLWEHCNSSNAHNSGNNNSATQEDGMMVGNNNNGRVNDGVVNNDENVDNRRRRRVYDNGGANDANMEDDGDAVGNVDSCGDREDVDEDDGDDDDGDGSSSDDDHNENAGAVGNVYSNIGGDNNDVDDDNDDDGDDDDGSASDDENVDNTIGDFDEEDNYDDTVSEKRVQETYKHIKTVMLEMLEELSEELQELFVLELKKMVDNTSWECVNRVCKELHSDLPKFSPPEREFEVELKHIDLRYRKAVSTIGLLGYEPVICNGDGNCLFNAISIALSGDAGENMMLRGIAFVHAVAKSKEIAAWYKTNRNISDAPEDVAAFLASYGCEEYPCKTIQEYIEREARTTLEGGVFSGYLQALFVCGAIHISISQHTSCGNMQEYSTVITPVPDAPSAKTLYIMWVSQDMSDEINHVIPLLPVKKSLFNDKSKRIKFCGAGKLCQLYDGTVPLQNSGTLVQCDHCMQWFHEECVHFTPRNWDKAGIWSCGCHLQDLWGFVEKETLNTGRGIQKLLCQSHTAIKDILAKITSGKITSKRKILNDKGKSWGTQVILYNKDALKVIENSIIKLSGTNIDRNFLCHVLCPEILAYALTNRLKINRLSAELILQNLTYSQI